MVRPGSATQPETPSAADSKPWEITFWPRYIEVLVLVAVATPPPALVGADVVGADVVAADVVAGTGAAVLNGPRAMVATVVAAAPASQSRGVDGLRCHGEPG